jgi:hypothetical protein
MWTIHIQRLQAGLPYSSEKHESDIKQLQGEMLDREAVIDAEMQRISGMIKFPRSDMYKFGEV